MRSSFFVRSYRLLLQLLPARFRRRHREGMEDLLVQALEAAEAGGLARLRVWAAACVDVLGWSLRLRLGGRRREPDQSRGIRSPRMTRTTGGMTMRMETLLRDLGFGLRTLRKNPGFTLVAVVTLALGIGANTIVFSVVNGVLLKPLPYDEPHRLALIWNDLGQGAQSLPAVSALDFRDYQDRSETFRDFAAGSGREVTLTGAGAEPELVDMGPVTHDFFDLLGVRPALGREFQPEEDVAGGPAVTVLSHRLWARRYGSDPSVVGRTVEINGRGHRVVGVLPADFRLHLPAEAFMIRDADLWVPMQYDYANAPPRNYTGFTVFGRLAPGASFQEAREEMASIAADFRREFPVHASSNLRIRVVPLLDDVVKGVRPALYTLLGAVGFVLLIACANVAHLLLARGGTRERELAVRAALGAGRGALVRQLLVESVLLAGAGGLVGLGITYLGLDLFRALAPVEMPRVGSVTVDGGVVAFTAAVCLGTALVFGIIPALQGARTDVAGTLADGGRTGVDRRRSRVRRLLIGGEIALSLVLLVGAGLLIRSFASLQEVRPGFRPDGVLTFRVHLAGDAYDAPVERHNFFRGLTEDLRALPGVESVGATSQLPLTGSGFLQPYAYDEETARNWESVTADSRLVTEGFFEAMGTRILEGRDVRASDLPQNPRVIIVDERVAQRAFPGESAVGRRLQLGPEGPQNSAEIVGVVEHVRLHDLTRPVLGQIYTPYGQALTSSLSFAVRASAGAEALAPRIRELVSARDPMVPVSDLRPMGALVERARGPARLTLALMAAFAVVALVLAAVGIYGVVSFWVGRRTREIGIRMALGEAPGEVRTRIVGLGMRLVLVGTVLGLVLAAALSRLLSGLLFGVNPTDPVTYLTISAVLAGVALLACWVPARRATRIDPLTALRTE